MSMAALRPTGSNPLLARRTRPWVWCTLAISTGWRRSRYFAKALGMNPSVPRVHTDAVTFLLRPLDRLDDAMELLAAREQRGPVVASRAPHAGAHPSGGREVRGGEPDRPLGAERVVDGVSVYPSSRSGAPWPSPGSTTRHSPYFKKEGGDGSGYMGYVYAVTGRRDNAEALAAKENSRPPPIQFFIYAGLGDEDVSSRRLRLYWSTADSVTTATWMMQA